MPFIESIGDMDALRRKRDLSAPIAAQVATCQLSACSDTSGAQAALLGLLWRDQEARKPSATYTRLLRYAYRLTRDIERARDCMGDAYVDCLQRWQSIGNAEGYMWRAIRSHAGDWARRDGQVMPVGDSSDLADMEESTAKAKGLNGRYSATRATLCWLHDTIATDADEKRVIRLALAWVDDEHVGYGKIAAYADLDAIGRELGVSGTQIGRICKRIGVRAGLWANERLAAHHTAQVGSRRTRGWIAGGDRHLWSVVAWFCTDRTWDMQQLDIAARTWAKELVCELIYRACIEPRLLPAAGGN